MQEWLDRSDWSKRSAEFGPLTVFDREVHIEWLPSLPPSVWDAWLALPQHPHILRARTTSLLRYAPIDWDHEPVPATDVARIARIGVALARTYKDIATSRAPAWLTQPIVKLDIGGRVRIGFGRPTDVLVEMLSQWPHCDERALVYVVAKAMRQVTAEIDPDSPIGRVLQRGSMPDPTERYPSLGALITAFQTAGQIAVTSALIPADQIWFHFDLGLGFLAIDRPIDALDCFMRAKNMFPRARGAQFLADVAAARRVDIPADRAPQVRLPGWALELLGVKSWPPTEGLPWTKLERVGHALERDRNFTAALAVYEAVRFDGESETAPIDQAFARARCWFECGDADRAIDLARKFVAIGRRLAREHGHLRFFVHGAPGRRLTRACPHSSS